MRSQHLLPLRPSRVWLTAGALLAADGDHPNAAGNNLISAALMAAAPMGDIQHLKGTG